MTVQPFPKSSPSGGLIDSAFTVEQPSRAEALRAELAEISRDGVTNLSTGALALSLQCLQVARDQGAPVGVRELADRLAETLKHASATVTALQERS